MEPRITVFGPDLRVQRTLSIGGLAPGFELFPLQGDSILLSGLSFRPDRYGLPVHLLSPEGRLVRSFGAPEGAIVPSDEYRLARTIAPAEERRVWVAPKDRYRVELWTLEGERRGGFRGDVKWFEPIPPSPDLPTPPKSVLSSLRQAPDGLLWIKFIVPSPTWPQAHERDPQTGRWRRVDGDLRSNTVIDVVDPETNRLLARGQLYGLHTALFPGPRGEPLIARVHVDVEAAQVRVLVIGMMLTPPRS